MVISGICICSNGKICEIVAKYRRICRTKLCREGSTCAQVCFVFLSNINIKGCHESVDREILLCMQGLFEVTEWQVQASVEPCKVLQPCYL